MGIAAIGTGIAITIDVIATMIITTITMITIITTIMMITITAMTMATRARYPWAPERLR